MFDKPTLVAADSVIIPSQPNFLSTKGLNLLLRSISKIKRQINPRLKIDGILLTMVDNRTNNAKAIISSLRSAVGENIHVFRSEIPFSVRAAECSLSGESIFSHDRNGKVAAVLHSSSCGPINKEVIDSINTAHKLSTLEALLRKVISEELRNISLHIPFEPDTDSASDENESSIMDFLESF